MMQNPDDGTVLHQKEKLLYLLNVRGDQRPHDPRRRGYVLDAKDSRIVRNQASLADALGIGEPVVSRWIARSGLHSPHPIDHILRKEICRIYKISEAAFVALPIDDFIKHCEGAKPAWRGVVSAAPIQQQAILTDGAADMRFPVLQGEESEANRIRVVVEKPFWMQFRSPFESGTGHQWSDWHLLLFNHDEVLSAFKCYLPRYEKHPAFGVSKFPSAGGVLKLPKTPALFHPESDVGKDFEMVLVLCRSTFPSQILGALADGTQGSALDADLDELADWLDQPLRAGSASVVRAQYRVVGQSR